MNRQPSAFDGQIFVTPSGRRWRAGYEYGGKIYMQPLGTDTYVFGGVKRRYVEPDRLDGSDKVWKPERSPVTHPKRER